HAELGARIVETIPGGAQLAPLVRHHHERFDGHGYPEGLAGEQIPLGARIIAVAEAYVNMTADRPYASVKSPSEAMVELESLSGTQFDGMLVRILIRRLKGEKTAKL
ncbi:MAG TPA: HD domain-containing phosphohydrolase, partial [Terriglobales bacterium]|nr:HD domain-containing phosphohydrolase [Terriglobales bacterium]